MSAPITIHGGLPRDPELRMSRNGNAIASFTVITSRRKKDESTGQWSNEDTSFFDVSAFGQLAENICESLVKGHQVIVTGRMRQREWENNEGQKRRSWELLADDVAVSCKYKTVTVGEGAPRRERQSAPPQDPWAGEQGGNGYDSEPPF